MRVQQKEPHNKHADPKTPAQTNCSNLLVDLSQSPKTPFGVRMGFDPVTVGFSQNNRSTLVAQIIISPRCDPSCGTLYSKQRLDLCYMQWFLLPSCDTVVVDLSQILVVLTESIECRLSMRKVRNLNPSQIKSMTYKTDTCCYLACRSALIG